MNKRGFTLVEILGVITLLAIITLIALPPIINQISNKKSRLIDAMKENVYSGADLYIKNNIKKYNENKNYCIKLSTLVNGDYVDESIYSFSDTDNRFNENAYIRATRNVNNFSYEIVNSCVEG